MDKAHQQPPCLRAWRELENHRTAPTTFLGMGKSCQRLCKKSPRITSVCGSLAFLVEDPSVFSGSVCVVCIEETAADSAHTHAREYEPLIRGVHLGN